MRRDGRSMIYAAQYRTDECAARLPYRKLLRGHTGDLQACELKAQGKGERMSERIEDLPVAVIGGSPVGPRGCRAASARAACPCGSMRAGETVAANVRNWGHVRLFSFWRLQHG